MNTFFYVTESDCTNMRIVSRHETMRQASEALKAYVGKTLAGNGGYSLRDSDDDKGFAMITDDDCVVVASFEVMQSYVFHGGGDMIESADDYLTRDERKVRDAFSWTELEDMARAFECELDGSSDEVVCITGNKASLLAI